MGPRIDEPLALASAAGIHFFGVDGLGSLGIASDSAGNVANSYAFDAWGSRVASQETLAQPFGYTAREVAEAGLWYYRARYYHPDSGRFLAEDPVRQWYRSDPRWDADGLGSVSEGPFAYVDSNPILRVDPDGEYWWIIPAGAGILACIQVARCKRQLVKCRDAVEDCKDRTGLGQGGDTEEIARRYQKHGRGRLGPVWTVCWNREPECILYRRMHCFSSPVVTP